MKYVISLCSFASLILLNQVFKFDAEALCIGFLIGFMLSLLYMLEREHDD